MTAPSLKTQLEAACQDLWWSSEADYPVEVVWYELSAMNGKMVLDDAVIYEIAGCEEDTAITTPDFNDLTDRAFEACFAKQLTPKSWHTAEDKQHLQQLGQLKNLLSEALSPPLVYRCGEVEVTLCILGYVRVGIIAGVKTCIVET